MKRTAFSFVTCVLLTLATILSVASADSAHAQEAGDAVARSLVGDWITAAGGMEAYSTLRSARFTLTTEIYDPESGRPRRTRTRYVVIARIERWEGDDFIQQGWDGANQWATLNGAPPPHDPAVCLGQWRTWPRGWTGQAQALDRLLTDTSVPPPHRPPAPGGARWAGRNGPSPKAVLGTVLRVNHQRLIT
jgi:hypothetical protein